MTQFAHGNIDPNTKSGTALASDLTNKEQADLSQHSGASRPTYAVAGTIWLNTAAAPNNVLTLYDGTRDIPFAAFNTTTGIVSLTLPSIKGAQTTPPGSPATNDSYLVSATATGAWAGQEGKVATWDGAAWQFTNAPVNSTIVDDNGVLRVTDSAGTVKSPLLVDLNGGSLSGERNVLDNPRMLIRQRPNGIVVGAGANAIIADRWIVLNGTDQACTVYQQDGTVGGEQQKILNMDWATAATSGTCHVFQAVEDVARITDGEWTHTVDMGVFGMPVPAVSSWFEQHFGTGGSPSAKVDGATVALTPTVGTWTTLKAKHSVPSIAGKTMGTTDTVGWFNVLTSFAPRGIGNVAITNCAFVKGDTTNEVDPVGRISAAAELLRCQRFYEIGDAFSHIFSGRIINGGVYYKGTPFAVAKRRTPTMTLTHVASAGFAAVAGTPTPSTDGFYEGRTASASNDAAYFQSTWTADADYI